MPWMIQTPIRQHFCNSWCGVPWTFVHATISTVNVTGSGISECRLPHQKNVLNLCETVQNVSCFSCTRHHHPWQHSSQTKVHLTDFILFFRIGMGSVRFLILFLMTWTLLFSSIIHFGGWVWNPLAVCSSFCPDSDSSCRNTKNATDNQRVNKNVSMSST